MSTNFSYVQIAQLYADNKVCGQPLVICTATYECEDLMWILNYFNTSVPHTPANCKDEFIELFNMYYGTTYTDVAEISNVYTNFCTTTPNICGSIIELTSCEQSWAFLQQFYEDHPDPKGEFGNECESVFMLTFNSKYGTNYTEFQDLVNYYAVCGVTLNVCAPLCETLYEYILTSMPGITCSGLALPLSAGQQLFVSLFNQQIKTLAAKSDGELLQDLSLQLIQQLRSMAEHEFNLSEVMDIVSDCSPAYTGCLSLINPNLENQNLNVNDPDVLISIKQAYYLMHTGGLPSNCETDFTSWFNLIMGTVYDYEDLQDLYQTVAGPGSQYICKMPTGEPEIVLGGNTTIDITTAPLLCGLNEPLFTDGPITVDPCADLLNIATSFGEDAYELYKDSLRNVFDTAYLNKCLSIKNTEKLTVTYTVSEYHYTLYYYDQAGNLVKTIPPEGVHPLEGIDWQEQVRIARANGTVKTPEHTLPTNYRYNTLNQVIAQHTPDAELSEFWYDRLGRLVVSRNAKQKVHNRYSYTKYDDLGRITEVGQKPKLATAAEMSQVISQNASDEPGSLKVWLNTTVASEMKEQITGTVYDEGYEPFCSNTNSLFCQKNLRNRVSYTYVKPTEIYTNAQNDPIPWDAATLYSYDIHGNVDVMLQDYRKGLGEVLCEGSNDPSGNRWKKIEYAYDLISGKVNEVAYQSDQVDAFYHRYEYDAENRITEVFTSKDRVYWERDAAYNYYKHGPLARTLLGHDFVQGIDYAYTLQGWLKGVNSTSVGDGAFDMGSDGTGTTNALVAKDVYGFSLNYFNGDYAPISSSVANTFVSVPNNLAQTTLNDSNTPDGVNTGLDLFNGNIRAMMVNIPKVGNANLYAYRYDQLNRLLAMNTYYGFDNATNSFTSVPMATNDYKERIYYDANGNISTYLRNGAAGVSGIAMDNLFYQYPIHTNGEYIRNNKLRNVLDLGGGTYTEDIKSNAPAHITDEYQLFSETLEGNQPTDNYKYDEIGNLIYDNKEGIINIEWNVYGKIASIEKATGTIFYSYDASGNRISKKLNGKTTYYVRDAGGNVMSVYEEGNTQLNGGDLTQSEIHLYGSSRLGIFNVSVNMECVAASGDVNIFTRGNKFFELSNHLGNVLVTITDNRRQHSPDNTDIDYYEAEIATANDYYPFGMQMPGRKDAGSGYRYGFNGKENDIEVNGSGNQYDYGFRIYNPRLGRFLSMDPLAKEYSMLTPYQFASNSPVAGVDLDGLEFY